MKIYFVKSIAENVIKGAYSSLEAARSAINRFPDILSHKIQTGEMDAYPCMDSEYYMVAYNSKKRLITSVVGVTKEYADRYLPQRDDECDLYVAAYPASDIGMTLLRLAGDDSVICRYIEEALAA